MKKKSKVVISNSFNQPLFSERIIEDNFYQELQKNGWCELVDYEPEKLRCYIKVLEQKRPQIDSG